MAKMENADDVGKKARGLLTTREEELKALKERAAEVRKKEDELILDEAR